MAATDSAMRTSPGLSMTEHAPRPATKQAGPVQPPR